MVHRLRYQHDEIDVAIAQQRDQMWSQIKGHILKIVFILVGLILFCGFLFTRMAVKTRTQFDAFATAFNNAVRSADPIDEHVLQWGEFKSLASSANHMLQAREAASNLCCKAKQSSGAFLNNPMTPYSWWTKERATTWMPMMLHCALWAAVLKSFGTDDG